MSEQLLSKYIETNRELVHRSVADRLKARDKTISPDAVIGEGVHLGDIRRVGAGANIGSLSVVRSGVSIGRKSAGRQGVLYGRNVRIGSEAEIQGYVTIRPGARIGARVSVGQFSFIGRQAILPGVVERRHPYQNYAQQGVIIGHHVEVPAEFQLGTNAVIPNGNCITTIGRLGTTQRMVTVYGGDEGPLYGVGCQYGISEEDFRNRIKSNTETTADSASDYDRYWPVLTAAGCMVQKAYELAESQVEDLKAEADSALAERTRHCG